MHSIKIILASASPRRREILEKTGIDFTIDVPDCEEIIDPSLTPTEVARSLSLLKATTVALRHREALIIAADTIVVTGDEILGKPESHDEAKEMLAMLSGRTHTVITGFTVMDTTSRTTVTSSVATSVTFSALTPHEIEAYVASGEPLDKAGAYGVQGLGAVIVERIDGDFFNVMGLPLNALSNVLKDFGIDIFSSFKG